MLVKILSERMEFSACQKRFLNGNECQWLGAANLGKIASILVVLCFKADWY